MKFKEFTLRKGSTQLSNKEVRHDNNQILGDSRVDSALRNLDGGPRANYSSDIERITKGKKMTFEEMKKVLYGFREARIDLERSQRELEECETMVQGLSLDYSKPRVIKAKEGDKLSSMIDRLIALREKCCSQGEIALDQMEKVKEIIDSVENAKGREILSRRYISCQHWNTIAYEMRLDRRWLFTLHDREVNELCKRY